MWWQVNSYARAFCSAGETLRQRHAQGLSNEHVYLVLRGQHDVSNEQVAADEEGSQAQQATSSQFREVCATT